MRSLVCSPRAQSFGSGCHVNCRGERSAPGANQNLPARENLRSWYAFVFSPTCLLNESRLDLIPILYFD
jgi:hypothetical protein